LGAALLAALAQWQVGGLSPAAALALGGVLLMGTYYSPQAGACGGVLFGFAADLALTTGPYHTALFALSGMGAGLCGRSRRGRGSLCCVAAALLVAAAWQEAGVGIVAESLFAALVLVLLPRRWFRSVRQRLEEAPFVPAAIPAMTQVRQRLEDQSHAFRRVYDQLRLSLSQSPPPVQDNMLVFQRASERVCVSCIKYHRCWRQQRGETRNQLTAAYPRLMERGQGVPQDFPPQFAQRCVHFSAYLGAVNQEVSALLAQRQYQARLRESRWAVCSQYGEVARLLSSASSALSARPEEDKSRTRRLEDHLRRQGIPAQGRVIYDAQGHLMVELLGRDLSLADTPELIHALSPLLSLPLRRGSLSAQPEGQRLTLVQKEPYAVSAGIASLPRAGNSISGDTCRWYKGEDGILRVILCDGMGCGQGAAQESSMTLRLLEAFLQGGLEPVAALRTVCSALGLRGELAGGYSTVDLLTIDLFSCRGDLYKLGAAPSYLCRGNQVHRIAGGALPAGSMGASQSPAVTHLPLAPGDTLLLISDGVSDGLEDDWLRRGLLSGGQLDARGLALALLNHQGEQRSQRDDQTAVVLRISKRLG
jgi:stage II sporulation protein E